MLIYIGISLFFKNHCISFLYVLVNYRPNHRYLKSIRKRILHKYYCCTFIGRKLTPLVQMHWVTLVHTAVASGSWPSDLFVRATHPSVYFFWYWCIEDVVFWRTKQNVYTFLNYELWNKKRAHNWDTSSPSITTLRSFSVYVVLHQLDKLLLIDLLLLGAYHY